MTARLAVLAIAALAAAAFPAAAQQRPAPTPGDTLVSHEQVDGPRMTLRLYAPDAQEVTARGDMQPGPSAPLAMTKDADGVWTGTTGPLTPGAYRYNFVVDGVIIADPKNTEVSSDNSMPRSLFHVTGPGGEFQERQDVPHGAVAEVVYDSVLGIARRMHVYTPPGYGLRAMEYPVLYLLHGAGDDDQAWSTVGRANVIMDNLIAAGAAEPMIVVMPAGHVPPELASNMFGDATDAYARDMVESVIPYIDANYRTLDDEDHRAIAGLSMGGFQTLTIGFRYPELFDSMGVFSSGLFGGPDVLPQMRAQYGAALETANDEYDVIWSATGSDDFVLDSTEAMLAVFDEYDIENTHVRSKGGHTWVNWRAYLNEFAPLLFKE